MRRIADTCCPAVHDTIGEHTWNHQWFYGLRSLFTRCTLCRGWLKGNLNG